MSYLRFLILLLLVSTNSFAINIGDRVSYQAAADRYEYGTIIDINNLTCEWRGEYKLITIKFNDSDVNQCGALQQITTDNMNYKFVSIDFRDVGDWKPPISLSLGSTYFPPKGTEYENRYGLVTDLPLAQNVVPILAYTEKNAHAAQKAPWEMTRQEWIDAGSPDLNINVAYHTKTKPKSLEKDANLERAAINSFISLFKDPVESIKAGQIGRVDKAFRHLSEEGISAQDLKGLSIGRQIEFANGKWWDQLAIDFPRSEISEGSEDARLGIIIGRKLGYFEHDILAFIVRCFIPVAYDAIMNDMSIPSEVMALHPRLIKK